MFSGRSLILLAHLYMVSDYYSCPRSCKECLSIKRIVRTGNSVSHQPYIPIYIRIISYAKELTLNFIQRVLFFSSRDSNVTYVIGKQYDFLLLTLL
jgi:hypothetical protein